jgi:hypothetical protein
MSPFQPHVSSLRIRILAPETAIEPQSWVSLISLARICKTLGNTLREQNSPGCVNVQKGCGGRVTDSFADYINIQNEKLRNAESYSIRAWHRRASSSCLLHLWLELTRGHYHMHLLVTKYCQMSMKGLYATRPIGLS